MENKTFSREDFDKLLALKYKYNIPFYRYKFDLKEINTNNDFIDLCEALNFLRQLQCGYEDGEDIENEDLNYVEDIDYIEEMINKIEEIVVIKVQD